MDKCKLCGRPTLRVDRICDRHPRKTREIAAITTATPMPVTPERQDLGDAYQHARRQEAAAWQQAQAAATRECADSGRFSEATRALYAVHSAFATVRRDLGVRLGVG